MIAESGLFLALYKYIRNNDIPINKSYTIEGVKYKSVQ